MSMDTKSQELMMSLLDKDPSALTASDIGFLKARSGYWMSNPAYVEKFRGILGDMDLNIPEAPAVDPQETLTPEAVQTPQVTEEKTEVNVEQSQVVEEGKIEEVETGNADPNTTAPAVDTEVGNPEDYDDGGASDPDKQQ